MSDISAILGVRPIMPARAPMPRTQAPGAAGRKAFYRSTKSYSQNEGLSCCFRQWRAGHSHCRLIHGYSLSFHFVFACEVLDDREWVFDFGNLKPVRAWLHDMFDHTTLVAQDDPELDVFQDLANRDLIDLRVVSAVGCEATARYVHEYVNKYAHDQSNGRVWVETVEVGEHSGNSALYTGDPS